jgi:hypothetical protein
MECYDPCCLWESKCLEEEIMHPNQMPERRSDQLPETAEYNGKRYRKLKSLAPVEVLKDVETKCEKENFSYYCFVFGYFIDPEFKYFIAIIEAKERKWLPWLIQKRYVEEMLDRRTEHLIAFEKYVESVDYQNRSSATFIHGVWDWFDQHPVPRKEKP